MGKEDQNQGTANNSSEPMRTSNGDRSLGGGRLELTPPSPHQLLRRNSSLHQKQLETRRGLQIQRQASHPPNPSNPCSVPQQSPLGSRCMDLPLEWQLAHNLHSKVDPTAHTGQVGVSSSVHTMRMCTSSQQISRDPDNTPAQTQRQETSQFTVSRFCGFAVWVQLWEVRLSPGRKQAVGRASSLSGGWGEMSPTPIQVWDQFCILRD